MKTLLTILLMGTFVLSSNAQVKDSTKIKSVSQAEYILVEASCGQCQFGMKSKSGCDLALRMNGKTYWVDGTDIHSHGDAHGKNGFCNAIRKAKVKGEVKDERFKATAFELLPAEK